MLTINTDGLQKQVKPQIEGVIKDLKSVKETISKIYVPDEFYYYLDLKQGIPWTIDNICEKCNKVKNWLVECIKNFSNVESKNKKLVSQLGTISKNVTKQGTVNKSIIKAAGIAGKEVAQEAIRHDGKVDCIYDIKEWLNNKYGFDLELDDKYSSDMKEKLIMALQNEFNKQFNMGLAVDGIFGKNTKNACVNVSKGAQGNITMIIQMLLSIQGYNLDMDKIYGSDTQRKVKEFQKENDIAVDGIVGKQTFEKLMEGLTEKTKEFTTKNVPKDGYNQDIDRRRRMQELNDVPKDGYNQDINRRQKIQTTEVQSEDINFTEMAKEMQDKSKAFQGNDMNFTKMSIEEINEMMKTLVQCTVMLYDSNQIFKSDNVAQQTNTTVLSESNSNWFEAVMVADWNNTIALNESMVENTPQPLLTIGASITNAFMSVIKGFAELGESLMDGLVAAGGIISAGSVMYNTADMNATKAISDEIISCTMSFVAEEHVQNVFKSFYDETIIGQWLDENAVEILKSDGVGYNVISELSYIAGILLLGQSALSTELIATFAGTGRYTRTNMGKYERFIMGGN